MNGAILGMTKSEINSKLDEIVDFSGCERYIDTPVKRYSSGMMVRLGFAVAAHLDPEILVVDEVLAVGDAEFQKKAIGKMQDVSRGEGRTVLFVSHNMGSIRQLCKTGILLDKGTVALTGAVNDVIDEYLAGAYEEKPPFWKKPTINPDQTGQLVAAEIKDANGNVRNKFTTDEEITLDLHISIKKLIPGTYGYLDVLRVKDGMKVFVSDSNDVEPKKLDRLQIGMNHIRVVFPKYLFAPGSYLTGINLNSPFAQSENEFIDRAQYVVGFEVHDYSTQRGDRREGFSSKLLDWDIV
jgi:lipopolysaccharide transport system ATP-binding protein